MSEFEGDRPVVTLKIAQSLDGRIATASGDSRWITGMEARRAGHRLRSQHGAILVGVGTVLTDDPELTVRHVRGENPIRIVLDSTLRTPPEARVLRARDARTIVATTERANTQRRRELERRGARVLTIAGTSSRISLPELMNTLRQQNIESVLVEGGPTVWTSFLQARLVDRMVVFIAPKILGGGKDAVGDLCIPVVAAAITIESAQWSRVGDDMMIRGTPGWGEGRQGEE